MAKMLERRGWVRKQDIVPEFLLNELSDDYERLFKQYKNSKYPNVSQLDISELEKNKCLADLLNIVSGHLAKMVSSGIVFSKLWLVTSEPMHTKKNELPYVPHIDKNRFLKVMIYMGDVTIDDGPLSLATVRPKKYEEFRKNLPKDHQERKMNVIRDSIEYEPMLGKRGTTVFFDTNCPHYGGIVKQNHKRRVMRLDFIRQAVDGSGGNGLIKNFVEKIRIIFTKCD